MHLSTGNSSNDYLKRITDAVLYWLQPDNDLLKQAIDKTVSEGLFSFEDVKFQIRSLKKSVTSESIRQWTEKQKLKPGELKDSNVLTFHAGNLPLVGFQDLLAVALTGAAYRGKISRRDPYLLPTFLNSLKKHGVLENAKCSTNPGDFKGFCADSVIFSGSTSSVGHVLQSARSLNLVKQDPNCLIRTAHYSIAFLQEETPEAMKQLTEAVFRYGGKGCRSVAVVVSPLKLDEVKCHFTDYIESFWLTNPQHIKPPPVLNHRYAYNNAVGHPQAWLDDFLIEETEMVPETDFVLHWIPGNQSKLNDFISRYGIGLQSLYVTDPNLTVEGLNRKPELLSTAQTPPVDWKPDGIDTIGWLKGLRYR